MINLLDEAKKELNSYNKTLNDVLWYGTSEYKIDTPIEKFLDVSYDCDMYYDMSDVSIPCDLIIVGDGWKLTRDVNDNATCEYWRFDYIPQYPKSIKLDGNLVKYINNDIIYLSDVIDDEIKEKI